MEKRKHSRVRFMAEVVLKSGDITISGTTDNLSMKGMLLKTQSPVDINKPMEIAISLAGSELSIILKGEAVRLTDAGVAIQFREMDLDSFTHLKRLVEYNSDNADAIEDEFYKSIKTE